MTDAIGRTRWVVADGYIPGWSTGPEPEMTSHDSLASLNTGDDEAHVTLTLYYSDREPVGPYRVTIAPRRSKHVRLNSLEDPSPIPKATEYACLVESDVPVVLQFTRLDSRQAENSLMTTIPWSE